MSDRVIIVKKKKQKAGGHHGGSWKVAYADFVTAMMAFFMVMWIMGMEQDVRDLVQGYFENPIGFRRGFSGGQNVLSQGNSVMAMQLRRTILLRRRHEEAESMRDVKRQIDMELSRLGSDGVEFADAVEVVLTESGLRIEVTESVGRQVFFESASPDPTADLERVLAVVGQEISRLENKVVVEGHTDAVPFGRPGYSNWELSVDRANAARRALVAAGLGEDQIVEVRGYADRQLKVVDDPFDGSNRRITILMPFDTPGAEDAGGADEDPELGLDLESMGVAASASDPGGNGS